MRSECRAIELSSEDDQHIRQVVTHRYSKSPLLLACYFVFLLLLIFSFNQHGNTITSSSSSIPSFELELRRDGSKAEATNDAVDLPPLEELITQNGTIIGDISWMLDFAVIAFPKAGTTFMKDYLSLSKETFVYEREFCIKHYSDNPNGNSIGDFVKEYYQRHVKLKQPKYPKTVQFGLKCPGVFYRANDIHIYAKYFPTTKFIIGLRHPVSWFESFYNYQSYRNVSLPTTSELAGRCSNHQKVCTDRARFHAAIARLGKTPMADEEEINLLLGSRYEEYKPLQSRMTNPQNQRYLQSLQGLPNRVLLYEIRQIHDKDTSKSLSSSIQRYLNIQQMFPPISSYKQNKTRAINICDDKHDRVRRLLVEHGTDAVSWILNYLLKNPTIEVAAPDSFHELLRDWSIDPCSGNRSDIIS